MVLGSDVHFKSKMFTIQFLQCSKYDKVLPSKIDVFTNSLLSTLAPLCYI